MAVESTGAPNERERQSQSYAHGFNAVMGKYRIAALRPYCQGESMLDIGCGEGPVTLGLADLFTQVVGIDLNEVHLAAAIAAKPPEYVHFEVASIEEYQTQLRFDTILVVDILEHVVDPVAVLRKLEGLMSGKGRIIIVVPNAASIHRRIGLAMGMIASLEELSPGDHKVGHRRYYSRETLRGDILAAGLEIHKEDGILLKPFSNAEMEKLPEAYADACFTAGSQLPDLCAELVAVVKRPGFDRRDA